jgi:hypothetical protein
MPNEFIESSSNSELVMELIEVLKKEASLFETFLELLERQQRALVKSDISGLNDITERQREKVIEIGLLSKKRENLIKQLSLQEDIQGDLTVTLLVKTVASGQAALLEQLRDTILDLNTKITKVRSQNEMLVNRSRENIMKTMELLGRIKAPDNNYHNEGKLKAVQTNLALDRRA